MKITTAGAAAMVLAAICAVSLAIALPPSDGVGETDYIDGVHYSVVGDPPWPMGSRADTGASPWPRP